MSELGSNMYLYLNMLILCIFVIVLILFHKPTFVAVFIFDVDILSIFLLIDVFGQIHVKFRNLCLVYLTCSNTRFTIFSISKYLLT